MDGHEAVGDWLIAPVLVRRMTIPHTIPPSMTPIIQFLFFLTETIKVEVL